MWTDPQLRHTHASDLDVIAAALGADAKRRAQLWHRLNDGPGVLSLSEHRVRGFACSARRGTHLLQITELHVFDPERPRDIAVALLDRLARLALSPACDILLTDAGYEIAGVGPSDRLALYLRCGYRVIYRSETTRLLLRPQEPST